MNSKKIVDKVSKFKEVDRIEILSFGKSLKDYFLDINVDNIKKILEIKSKIDNGIYNVDVRLIVRSILNVMKENRL